MRYQYSCKNENCENFEQPVTVEKPMAESGRAEICEKCNEEMSRHYHSPGIKTFGDGYKA